MSAVLREVRWPDLTVLAQLEREIFPDDAWPLGSWWAELAERPRRDYLLLEVDEGVVGYAGLSHLGDVADVMTLAVHPARRGHGAGRQLLQALEERAARAGAAHLMLEVRADNDAALALYESAGYRLVTRRRGYYRPVGVDALVMRKEVPRVR